MSHECRYSPSMAIDRVERLLRARIAAWNEQSRHPHVEPSIPLFVTVSRQPGIDPDPVCYRLSDLLNAGAPGKWSVWDHELIEKVSSDQHLAKDLLEKLEETPRTWLDDMLQTRRTPGEAPGASEAQADRCMFAAIRSLALAGHAIIVGRGGILVTKDLKGGIHIRLVAPLKHRLEYVVSSKNIPLHEAARYLNRIDKNEMKHFHQYWPERSLDPETFGIMLNSAQLSVDELAECVAVIVRKREAEKQAVSA